jgi:hypothetical protein
MNGIIGMGGEWNGGGLENGSQGSHDCLHPFVLRRNGLVGVGSQELGNVEEQIRTLEQDVNLVGG